MDTRFRCLHCNEPIVVDNSLCGQDAKCPNCHNLCHVPAAVRLVRAASTTSLPAKPPPPPLPPPPPPSTSPQPQPVTPSVVNVSSRTKYRCNNPDCGASVAEAHCLLLE